MSNLVSDLVSRGTKSVPAHFVRPVGDRPSVTEEEEGSSTGESSFTMIDLQGLHGPNRATILNTIHEACKNDGFFLIKNHGIPDDVVNGMMEVSRDFFRLPESERLKTYSEDTTKTVRLSCSFNVNKEEVGSWRDYLRLHCYPLEDHVRDWPSQPPSFRQVASEYCTRVRNLALELLEALSESLGLETNHLNDALGGHGQHMAINYYPPCPQPELTYGLPGHTDPNALTILLQDDVPGLQVLKGGKWVRLNPIPKVFIVNIGDQIQVLSNGVYKSVLHRALVNSERERISIPTFYCPSPDAVIRPADGLVDEHNPPLYRRYHYREYYESFWDHGLKDQSCIEKFTI
ncbi:protein DMR6-LIKE OXYGENASE 2-like [Nymphaea colorata]|nr:protein DMR6-LIKE OXYGENASE 2-like [Nymphaea colorata]